MFYLALGLMSVSFLCALVISAKRIKVNLYVNSVDSDVKCLIYKNKVLKHENILVMILMTSLLISVTIMGAIVVEKYTEDSYWITKKYAGYSNIETLELNVDRHVNVKVNGLTYSTTYSRTDEYIMEFAVSNEVYTAVFDPSSNMLHVKDSTGYINETLHIE